MVEINIKDWKIPSQLLHKMRQNSILHGHSKQSENIWNSSLRERITTKLDLQISWVTLLWNISITARLNPVYYLLYLSWDWLFPLCHAFLSSLFISPLFPLFCPFFSCRTFFMILMKSVTGFDYFCHKRSVLLISILQIINIMYPRTANQNPGIILIVFPLHIMHCTKKFRQLDMSWNVNKLHIWLCFHGSTYVEERKFLGHCSENKAIVCIYLCACAH